MPKADFLLLPTHQFSVYIFLHFPTKTPRSAKPKSAKPFVVILPNTNAETATQVAEIIRLQVKNLEIPHPHNKAFQYVTLTCGVASTLINADFSPAALINPADRALYQAKAKGRDRVLSALN